MENKYQQWVEENYPTAEKALGKCNGATASMLEEFPELIRTNGFVSGCLVNGTYMHWWLKTAAGEIVDPTKAQYLGPITYEEIDDTHDARNYAQNKCPNCGEYYYLKPKADQTVCSDKCNKEYLAYLNG